MIILKNITLRNFLSIGAVTQAVNFDSKELTLILGENLDLGGDGARNGTGKTTLIQGLAYALFGQPINSIRKDNLINRTNSKGMMVTLEFSANGVEYKIERGRKPNILKFYVNSDLQTTQDDAQGENKETQIQIERAIGMTPDMFRHIVALNTYSEPFLAMKANDQRNVIEQLLGITLLSEKAEIIKEKIRVNKEHIQQEEFRNKAVEEANKRVQEQIDSVKRRQNLWQKKHDEDLSKLVTDYEDLSKIDIDAELKAHKDLVVYNENKKKQETYEALLARQTAWKQKRDNDVNVLQKSLDKLSSIDIDLELQSHKDLADYIVKSKELAERDKEVNRLGKDIDKDNETVNQLIKEINTLNDHKCYACGQDFHDNAHSKVLEEKEKNLLEVRTGLDTKIEHWNTLREVKIFLPEQKPVTHYKTEAEAVKHSSEVDNIKQQINTKLSESDPYAEQLVENSSVTVGSMPKTHYDTEAEAIEHRTVVANLEKSIAQKADESDPYQEQVAEMESQALQEVTFDKINELTKLGDHLKFLLDLLTSKDSFVRKKIIDQNLSYLNARLTHYLDKIGLPHTVVFKNDLSVEITELGRELDFDNLSRGERNRLILGLSFAFRDVWENLYFPINTLFIDELIDSGLDTIGVENAMAILKDMSRRRNKSIWLVSHREELAGRVPQVLKVIKENGFTTYNTTTDIE
jgi:DNA repair exonuclease SbcCD ATPase subunit